MFLEASSWILVGRLLLEGPKHAAEVAADRSHSRVVGAKGRLADRHRLLNLHPGAFQVLTAPPDRGATPLTPPPSPALLGYPFVLGLMLVVSVTLYLVFRGRGWL
jgi:hypothetical protein